MDKTNVIKQGFRGDTGDCVLEITESNVLSCNSPGFNLQIRAQKPTMVDNRAVWWASLGDGKGRARAFSRHQEARSFKNCSDWCSCTISLGGDPLRVYPKQPTFPVILWEYMFAGWEAVDGEDQRVISIPASTKTSQDLALIKCNAWRAFQGASSNKDR